jgi:tetratricopeptide (TPR) repeat protein
MRMPFTLAAVAVLACLTPRAAQSQTDTTLKLSTTVPQASAEFRAGVNDWQNLSFESSATHFNAASKADPNFGLARVMHGFVGNFAGEMTRAQAEAEINRGIADAAARGNTNELLLAAAYRASFQNNPRAATEIFDAASNLMPSDKLVAANAIGAGSVGAAPNTFLPSLREFIAKNPDYAPAYNTYAYTLWNNGDRAGALAAAKKQVELNPNAPNPHDTYAEILQWNGNFPEATAEYRRATTTPPRFPGSYSGMAEVEALQGHYDQARAYLRQAADAAWMPRQKLFNMYEIAASYALQGVPTDTLIRQLDAVVAEARAQQDLESAAVSLSMKAPTYATANNVAAAHKAIADAKAVSSPEPWQVNYFATMAHALMKHWGPANQELATMKQKTTDDQGARRTLVAAAEGNLATQQGHPADALKTLMAADTTDISVMNRIAEAHAALGHSAEANRWYGKISNNFALNLGNFPEVNARRRTRLATTGGKR